MRQFFIPDAVVENDTIQCEDKNYHYLVNVLRLEVNDVITGIDPHGERFLLRVLKIASKSIVLRTEKNISYEIAKNPVELILYQCVPKLPKMDGIIRMTTEAGISGIVPVISRYSQSNRVDAEAVMHRKQRWEKIATEALQQCGRKSVPVIHDPCNLWDIPDISGIAAVGIFGDESGKTEKSLHLLLDKPQLQRVLYVVGPEGGFHDEERQLLRHKKYSAISLGENILRVDTAAVYICAVIQFLLLEKNSWISKETK